MSQREETEKYIRGHIFRVRKWITHFSKALFERGEHHDESKLRSPEIEGWTQMDSEERYPYGSPEYEEKKARYKWLFDEHYSHNRHHPEYFQIHNNKSLEMDLLDLLELLCDWLGYRDSINYTDASELVSQQCKRYGFSDEIYDLLLNTMNNYFVDFGNLSEQEIHEIETYTPFGVKKKQGPHPHIDLLV